MLRNLEIFFFALVNYVPYVPIGFYPFREYLRFKKSTTYTLIALQIVVIILNHFAVEYGLSPEISTAITTITSISMLFLINRENLGKLVMTLLIVQNVAILIMNLAKYTESLFFFENTSGLYTWSQGVFIFMWQLIILTPLVFYMKKTYIPAISTAHDKKLWRYLWLIPATFYVLWQYSISFHRDFHTYAFSQRTSFIIMLILLSLGSFFIYHMTAPLLLEKVKSESYAVQNQTMKFQYENILERVAEAKRSRHDIRHHLVVIDQYLKDEKYAECRQYLNQYRTSLPHEESLIYCEHYATNALLTYMVQHGKEFGIKSEIKVAFPQNLPYPEEDLTIVFANLLENAVDASREVVLSGENAAPIVKVTGLYEHGMLMFRVENLSIRKAVTDQDNIFLSTKHEGVGIGVQSVRTIAEKYNGSVKINQPEGSFIVSVTLNSFD